LKVELNLSGYSEALTPSNPTQSEYQQLVTQYQNSQNLLQEAQEEYENARADLVGVKNIFANAIKGNLSGEVVFTNDVSPVEHNPNVWVHGKNLIPSTIYNMANWNVIDGTVNNYVFPLKNLKDGVKYTISASVLDNTFGYFYLEESVDGFVSNKDNHLHTPNNNLLPFTFEKKHGHEYRLFWFEMNRFFTDYATNIQLEEGETVTSYEEWVDPSTVKVRRCGKNLTINNIYDMEYGGITITKNANQSFYASGTATENLYFQINNDLFLREGRYILSGCPNGSPDTFILYLTNDDFYAQDVGKGTTFNFNGKSTIPLKLAIYKGATLNNVLFEPMIRLEEIEDGTFEPYNGSEHTPSSDGTVEGITSLSPNMTILTDTENVIVECEYIKDTNKVIEKIANALGITV
jgi:hypothetical protein